ncbi:MAG: hypothetical protein AB8F74_10000 [Saprospiraceae bacterium]
MTSFNVLATVDLLSERYLHTLIAAYNSFYNNQTPKHQSKLQLTLLSRRYFSYLHNSGIALSDMGTNIQVVYSTDAKEASQFFKKADVLFMPILEAPGPIVKNLLICGLPILCHQTSILRKHIDKTIRLVAGSKNQKEYNEIHAIEDYASMLEMLYFDPSVQKLMKKKADKKYRRKINAGGSPIGELQLDFVKKRVELVQLKPTAS